MPSNPVVPHVPLKLSHVRQALKNLVPQAAVGAAFFGAALGLFTAVFGWSRVLADFWPLDSSRVGPNLCASIFLIVLLGAKAEAEAVRQAEQSHESHRALMEDMENRILHPAVEAEKHLADDVEAEPGATVPDAAPSSKR